MEEERPRRLRRGTAEILRCYPVPVHFQNTTLLDSQYYFSAELPTSKLRGATPFCVGQWTDRQADRRTEGRSSSSSSVYAGDNRTYGGYWNAPLLPHKSYGIYYQAVSTANGVSSPGHR